MREGGEMVRWMRWSRRALSASPSTVGIAVSARGFTHRMRIVFGGGRGEGALRLCGERGGEQIQDLPLWRERRGEEFY